MGGINDAPALAAHTRNSHETVPGSSLVPHS